MEALSAVGAIHYWGYTPGVNFLTPFPTLPTSEINVLLSGTSDIRHILRTLSSLPTINEKSATRINFYINETEKEILARILLQLQVLNEMNMTKTERMELFLDLFGNSLVRQKTQAYLDSVIKPLIQLVTQDKKCPLSLKSLTDASLIKFKERDELEAIFASWRNSVPFDIEKLRDNRLRHYYKDKYDFRGNFVESDYHEFILKESPIVDGMQYRRFRQHGITFETRLEKYSVPNRTLSSYAQGKKWDSRDSCLVRGYWGDTIISPYFAFGAEVDSKVEKEKFFAKPKGPPPYTYNATMVSEFNVLQYLYKLQDFQDYHYPFEETTKEEPSAVKPEETKGKEIKNLLPGLDNANVKFYLLSSELSQIFTKPRFANLFDVAVIGFFHGQDLKEPFSAMMKEGAYVLTELPKNFVGIEAEHKGKCYDKIALMAKACGLTKIESPYDHHYLFRKA